MSGFGLREQFAAGRSLRHQQLTRDDVLLQQLTVNGSMLRAANHDLLWCGILATSLAQPFDHPWPALRDLLALLPASLARRAMWRASLRWWQVGNRHLLTGRALALRDGYSEQFSRSPGPVALAARLDRAAEKLVELEWCDRAPSAANLSERIEIVDMRRARHQALVAARKTKPSTQRKAKSKNAAASRARRSVKS
jgi:hypothetical protein